MEGFKSSEEKEQFDNENNTNETTQITVSVEISEEFWNNDVIWQEITSYLSIYDLKELCCVNHYFLQRVRSINRFTSLSGQVVAGKMEIHVFKLCRASVWVNTIDWNVLLEKASEIFQDTEYLELHGIGKLSDTRRKCLFVLIIASCPKLKSLAFGRYNFIGKKLDAFLTHSVLKLRMSQLKELHLEVQGKCYSDIDLHLEYPNSDEARDEFHDSITEPEIGYDPLQSFKLLSELQMSLVKFSYTSCQLGRLVSCFFSPELVLSSSQNTLVELNLHVHFGATLGFQNLKFPKLEKFSLMFNKALSYTKETFNQQTFDTNFSIFLKNHLLSLTHFELDSPECDMSFTAVCEVLKLSKKIKVLLLGREDRSHFEERVTFMLGDEWDNLANISSLRSLDVWTGHYHNDFSRKLHDILALFKRYGEVLPQTANSFKFWMPWWKGFENPDYFAATVKSTLMNFQNLVELKLFAFLNDEILQFICQHLTKLLVFEGEFSAVTDYGISGRREEDNYDSGISIANIKGLRKLHMHPYIDMPLKITWDGLLQSIHFLELSELTVMGQLKNSITFMHPEVYEINRRNYLRLICKTRNPSLKKVYLTFYKPPVYERGNIRRVNPRTKYYRDNYGYFVDNYLVIH